MASVEIESARALEQGDTIGVLKVWRHGPPMDASKGDPTMTANELRPVVQGLTFTEAPRWHQGRLWFSDFYSHRVLAVDPAGKVESIVTVPAQPSGLGWRPDGTMLIVSMLDRKLMRLDGRAPGRGRRSVRVRHRAVQRHGDRWPRATPSSATSASTAIVAKPSGRPP
jgi:sugar lactone lactonase YvrE